MKMHVLHVPDAPGRNEIVETLRQQPDSELCVHADPDRRGLMPNWLDALRCATNDTARWTAILSDDAVPLRGWRDHWDSATFCSPAPFLGLTHFGGWGKAGLAKNAAYSHGKHLVWGGGIAYKVSFLEGLTAFAEMLWRDLQSPHDDVIVSAFGQYIGTGTAMVNRALFDQANLKSLLGHNTPIRRPATTIENTLGPSYLSRKSVKSNRDTGSKGAIERLVNYVRAHSA